MIYNNWTNVVIIKIFGRKMGSSFLQNKITGIWKSTESITLIDLGYDYYLTKFSNPKTYDKALHGGPWFIGNQFLTVRKWEPKFVTSAASQTYSTIWARLPELPTEFYDYDILQKK